MFARRSRLLSSVSSPTNTSELDQRLDEWIARIFQTAEADALVTRSADLPLYDLLRYHLGYLNVDLQPERVNPGKRIRSKLCTYSSLAAGGNLEPAIPVAAAIELLHNFTLIHDDIQDRSLLRRHRPTLWARWGEAQAINAGDALFALAQLALIEAGSCDRDAACVLRLSREMQRMTLRIVEGQVLDLGFEGRHDVGPAEYVEMIGGKTAAICRFAAWAGAVVGGADELRAQRFGDFGFALGLGFQLHDDVLGIWGDEAATGKDAGDIRRKKKSYPVLVLFERAEAGERERLLELYARDELDDGAVDEIEALLEANDVRRTAEGEATRWHDAAVEALQLAEPHSAGEPLLEGLIRELAVRAN